MNEQDIFIAAMDRKDPAERQQFLDEACDGDGPLRKRVEHLIQQSKGLGSFLEHPPLEANDDALYGFDPTIVCGDGSTCDDECGAIPSEHNDTNQGPQDPDEEILRGLLEPATREDSVGRLGHYEVLNVVGKGAFGTVLRAFDTKLERIVAIKVLAREIASLSPARKRFLREARTSAQIRHENVVGIHSVEEVPIPYLVMEYIPGKTLQRQLEEHGPLNLAEVLRLGKQIADSLAAAHAQGLIHRDIKPGNILLEGGMEERVKITDFGLARTVDDASMTQSGVIAGTPMYMAPEQAHGDKLDQRADLFSFGSVLYQMLSGRPPFRASTTVAVLKRVADDNPRPIQEIIPEVPDWMCELIGHLHAKNPDERYSSAREVSELLARCAADLQAGRVPKIPYPSRTSQRDGEETTAGVPEPARRRGSSSRLSSPLVKIAAAVVILLGVLGITEATGVTRLASTVIRLATGSGTLVIETDDPGVKIAIDGEEVTIAGAGVEEIRLRPGDYKVAALKDGKSVKQELVSVTRNGRTVVQMTLESPPTIAHSARPQSDAGVHERSADARPTAIAPFADTDVARIASLKPVQQIEEIRQELIRRNSGFDGQLIPMIESGKITGLEFSTEYVSDISPLRALRDLKSVSCIGPESGAGKLLDLSPLRGLTLTELTLDQNVVHDLSPISEAPLQVLSLFRTKVRDLTPIKGMPLRNLNIEETQVRDLAPLEGSTITWLCLSKTKISDLNPLKGLQLSELHYWDISAKDMSVLKGLPLVRVYTRFQPERDSEVLRSITTLETINDKAVAEFWKQVDADASADPARGQ